MSAATLDAERPFGAITAQWRGPESPKAFFRCLRSAPSYFHEMIARGLHEAGFQVRYVRKRANHQVWNLYLLRDSVSPGTEAEAARQAISVTLRRCGVECPKKEIEIAVIGQTVGAAFIFPSGAPGTLAFLVAESVGGEHKELSLAGHVQIQAPPVVCRHHSNVPPGSINPHDRGSQA